MSQRTWWPRCAHRRSRRKRRSHARVRRGTRSTGLKQKIFFTAVLFAACVMRRVSKATWNQHGEARRTSAQAGERIAWRISSSSRFFASHKPDCAKVRELSDAFRGAEAVCRTRRCGVDSVDDDGWSRRTGACTRTRCRPRRGPSRPDSRVGDIHGHLTEQRIIRRMPMPATQRKSRSRGMRAASLGRKRTPGDIDAGRKRISGASSMTAKNQ